MKELDFRPSPDALTTGHPACGTELTVRGERVSHYRFEECILDSSLLDHTAQAPTGSHESRAAQSSRFVATAAIDTRRATSEEIDEVCEH